jgi:hypothetical protein
MNGQSESPAGRRQYVVPLAWKSKSLAQHNKMPAKSRL